MPPNNPLEIPTPPPPEKSTEKHTAASAASDNLRMAPGATESRPPAGGDNTDGADKSVKPESPPPAGGDTLFGVPGGRIMEPFKGAHGHQGIDVQSDRGTPVSAHLRLSIPIEELNSARVLSKGENVTGLGISGTNDAQLINAEVRLQPWQPSESIVDKAYGGIVGLAAHYQHQDADGNKQIFTIYVEYEHLITADYLPRNDKGQFVNDSNKPIEQGTYQGPQGFGDQMKSGKLLTAAELDQQPLIGYLGATEHPHVHIQAVFDKGSGGYLRPNTKQTPNAVLFDPSVIMARR